MKQKLQFNSTIFGQVDERVITLIGEMRGNQIALDMILEKVCDDPNALSCGDIHYEGMGSQPSSTYYSRKSSVEAGEEYGTSPSRRHSAVGGGGDIHLKMLIPRYYRILEGGRVGNRIVDTYSKFMTDLWFAAMLPDRSSAREARLSPSSGT